MIKSATVLALYTLGFNFYIYTLTRPEVMPLKYCKVFYYILTLSLLLFVVFDIKKGFVNFIHEQFTTMCFVALVINYIFQILTHMEVLQSAQEKFIIFNGSIFATTVLIGISMKRHGFFKQN